MLACSLECLVLVNHDDSGNQAGRRKIVPQKSLKVLEQLCNPSMLGSLSGFSRLDSAFQSQIASSRELSSTSKLSSSTATSFTFHKTLQQHSIANNSILTDSHSTLHIASYICLRWTNERKNSRWLKNLRSWKYLNGLIMICFVSFTEICRPSRAESS